MMNRSFNINIIWCFVLTSALLFAVTSMAYCAEDEVSTVNDQEVQKSFESSFKYNPITNRDPFVALVEQTPQRKNEPFRVREPLEMFDLDQLRLSAMMIVKNSPMAMVKAPDGKSYIVKINDRIGKFGGIVEALEPKKLDPKTKALLTPDRIKVKETVIDPYTKNDIVDYRYIAM